MRRLHLVLLRSNIKDPPPRLTRLTCVKICAQDAFGNAIDAREVSCRLTVTGGSASSEVHQACASATNGTSLTATLYTTSAALYMVSVELASLADGEL